MVGGACSGLREPTNQSRLAEGGLKKRHQRVNRGASAMDSMRKMLFEKHVNIVTLHISIIWNI